MTARPGEAAACGCGLTEFCTECGTLEELAAVGAEPC